MSALWRVNILDFHNYDSFDVFRLIFSHKAENSDHF